MKTMFLALAITLIWGSSYMTANADSASDAVAQIAKTELAFAKMATDSGMVPAFLKYLHDDAVVFRPKPLNGKRWYGSRPNSPASLKWWPTHVEVAVSGDIGVSTGPYEFRSDHSDTVPTYYGHFVSIWKRQPNGEFLVMADLGNGHDKPDSVSHVLNINLSTSEAKKPVAANAATLTAAESALTALTSTDGTAAGFESYFDEDVRVYRDGHIPYVGKQAAQAAFADSLELSTYQTAFIDVSKGNDFGYSYGITRHWQSSKMPDTAESTSDLRVWRRNASGDWKIVLELALPIEK